MIDNVVIEGESYHYHIKIEEFDDGIRLDQYDTTISLDEDQQREFCKYLMEKLGYEAK